MTIRIEIAGMEELRRAFSNLDEVFDAAVADAVEDTVYEIDGEVKRRIARGPATGRVYEKYNPRRTHQASAPGEAPMTDTGRLVSSVYVDPGRLSATVGSRLAYAAYLEYGTRRMGARPVWRPVAEKEAKEFRKRIIENLKRAAR
jgi:HK97 gp10 family phage protein